MKINNQLSSRVAVERVMQGFNPLNQETNSTKRLKRKHHASSKYKQPIQIP